MIYMAVHAMSHIYAEALCGIVSQYTSSNTVDTTEGTQ